MNRTTETLKLQSLANDAWGILCECYPKVTSYDPPKIVLCGRLSRSAGLCFYTLNQIKISLKHYIYHQEYIINQVLPHELAHQVQFNLYGSRAMKAENGHGKEWRDIMAAYGIPADRFHELTIPQLPLAKMLGKYYVR